MNTSKIVPGSYPNERSIHMSLNTLIEKCIKTFLESPEIQDPVNGEMMPNSIYLSVAYTVDAKNKPLFDEYIFACLAEAVKLKMSFSDHDLEGESIMDFQRAILISVITEHICYEYPKLVSEDIRRQLLRQD